MAQYKTRDADILDGILNLISYTNIYVSLIILKLEEQNGQVMLQEDEIIPKKVLNGKFHNTRPVGKPRKRR